ncbi:MAG TPA: hypothetical protein PKC18_01165 [Lacipirellulaceae bacterium]|nr:hypothetical protein [Lacipirellulaceae bacterium]
MRPLMVVCDIDNDGVDEICVALHYRVIIYEGTTGRKESELRNHSSRNYGWFGVTDVDGDGQEELIVLADFQSHFDVLDYDPSLPEAERLSVRWRRDIGTDISNREKWPRVGPRPLADVTGDGRLEIILNLFNDQGDDQWHVVVIDSSSGDTVCDLPQRYFHGIFDVDGNGQAELCCTSTNGVHVPRFGCAEIVKVSPAPLTIWSHSIATFGTTDLSTIGDHWSTSATEGMRTLAISEYQGSAAIFVLVGDPEDASNASLKAIRITAENVEQPAWSVNGLPELTELLEYGADATGVFARVRCQLPRGATSVLTGTDAEPVVRSVTTLGSPPCGPIVCSTGHDDAPMIVVQGSAERIFAIRCLGGDQANPEIVWSASGRGIGNDGLPGTPVAVDLDGDGSPEIVFATRTSEGAAALTARHTDGSEFWTHAFPGVGGEAAKLNHSCLISWWPGRFRDALKVDLFVNTRRGLMHSEVGHLIDGRTGEEVWSHRHAVAEGVFHWGYAGASIAAADILGLGVDQIVNLFPVCYWLGLGNTGEIVNPVDLATRDPIPAWAAYGEPIVYDFDGDGQAEILLDSPYILALLDRNGQARWHSKPVIDYPTGNESDNIGEATRVRHAIIDLDGDGRMELASAGYGDGVRVIDPDDGAILWSLKPPIAGSRDTPLPTAKCTAVDINGDGGDELLFVSGSTLVAITGDRDGGRILWTWQGPAALSLPAVADVDGDQRAEIIVQSADGWIHCIDGPAVIK